MEERWKERVEGGEVVQMGEGERQSESEGEEEVSWGEGSSLWLITDAHTSCTCVNH